MGKPLTVTIPDGTIFAFAPAPEPESYTKHHICVLCFCWTNFVFCWTKTQILLDNSRKTVQQNLCFLLDNHKKVEHVMEKHPDPCNLFVFCIFCWTNFVQNKKVSNKNCPTNFVGTKTVQQTQNKHKISVKNTTFVFCVFVGQFLCFVGQKTQILLDNSRKLSNKFCWTTAKKCWICWTIPDICTFCWTKHKKHQNLCYLCFLLDKFCVLLDKFCWTNPNRNKNCPTKYFPGAEKWELSNKICWTNTKFVFFVGQKHKICVILKTVQQNLCGQICRGGVAQIDSP